MNKLYDSMDVIFTKVTRRSTLELAFAETIDTDWLPLAKYEQICLALAALGRLVSDCHLQLAHFATSLRQDADELEHLRTQHRITDARANLLQANLSDAALMLEGHFHVHMDWSQRSATKRALEATKATKATQGTERAVPEKTRLEQGDIGDSAQKDTTMEVEEEEEKKTAEAKADKTKSGSSDEQSDDEEPMVVDRSSNHPPGRDELQQWQDAKAGKYRSVCGFQCRPSGATFLAEHQEGANRGLPKAFEPCKLFPIAGNDDWCYVHYKGYPYVEAPGEMQRLAEMKSKYPDLFGQFNLQRQRTLANQRLLEKATTTTTTSKRKRASKTTTTTTTATVPLSPPSHTHGTRASARKKASDSVAEPPTKKARVRAPQESTASDAAQDFINKATTEAPIASASRLASCLYRLNFASSLPFLSPICMHATTINRIANRIRIRTAQPRPGRRAS